MGKHFWWGCGLLAFLLVLSLVVGMTIQHRQQPLWELLEEAQNAAEQDLSFAKQQLNRAKQQWERYAGGMAAISDHAPMDKIDEAFAEADLFGQAGDVAHFSTTCARLSQLLRSIANDHKLSWRNLF